MGFWISFIVILDINEEVPCSALLKEAHQRGLQSLHISCRDLVNLIEHDNRERHVTPLDLRTTKSSTENSGKVMFMKTKGEHRLKRLPSLC